MTHVLQENLEHATSLFVDETRDTLDTTTTRETADGGLGDSLDVVTKDFPVALGTAFAEAFATLWQLRLCARRDVVDIHALYRVQTLLWVVVK